MTCPLGREDPFLCPPGVPSAPNEIILATASELFHQRGYSAVTVDQVLEASGLPEAEFYRHFSDKNALGRA